MDENWLLQIGISVHREPHSDGRKAGTSSRTPDGGLSAEALPGCPAPISDKRRPRSAISRYRWRTASGSRLAEIGVVTRWGLARNVCATTHGQVKTYARAAFATVRFVSGPTCCGRSVPKRRRHLMQGRTGRAGPIVWGANDLGPDDAVIQHRITATGPARRRP